MKGKQIKIIVSVVIGLGVLVSGGVFVKNKKEQRRREEAERQIETLKRVIESENNKMPSQSENPWLWGGVKPE